MTVPVTMEALGWAFLLVILARQTCAFIPDFLEMGSCAKVTLKPDFDPVKYTGLWFDIESVPNEYQYTKMCVTQNYTWTGQVMRVATRGLTQDETKVQQGAVMHPEQDPAHMTVEAAGVPEAPYQIVDTDYRSFSCVYSCLEYFGFRAEFAWVFSRTPTLPDDKIKRCHDAFTRMKVDPEKMIPIVQGEVCPYHSKLQQMLADSEQYLLNILGPYVPAPSTTTVLPPHPTVEGVDQDKVSNVSEAMPGHKRQPSDTQGKGAASPCGGWATFSTPACLLSLLLLPLLLA
ncbi:crustacyanin-A2 subunit-like [Panulirus ornatus]|uniref:crustacyanin-A2 subunit-like n=1 Tax=Panulirus ornatus TaxID=150431 RepID=UPI003A859DCE